MLIRRRPQLHETTQRRTLCKQETRVELTFLANAVVEKDDLLPHIRDLSALGSLYRSLVRLFPFVSFAFANSRWKDLVYYSAFEYETDPGRSYAHEQ